MMTTLMHDVLGYSRYGVRGSDLGSVIARQMAITQPEQIVGVHLTGIIGTAGAAPPYTEAEQAFIDATQRVEPDLAYTRLHMSRPQSAAISSRTSSITSAASTRVRTTRLADAGDADRERQDHAAGERRALGEAPYAEAQILRQRIDPFQAAPAHSALSSNCVYFAASSSHVASARCHRLA